MRPIFFPVKQEVLFLPLVDKMVKLIQWLKEPIHVGCHCGGMSRFRAITIPAIVLAVITMSAISIINDLLK